MMLIRICRQWLFIACFNVNSTTAFGCFSLSCDAQLGIKAKGHICLGRQIFLWGQWHDGYASGLRCW